MTPEEVKTIIEAETDDTVLFLTNIRVAPDAIFYVCERRSTIPAEQHFNFLIKGFNLKTKEEYKDGFLACQDLQAAQNQVAGIVSRFMR